MHPAYMHLNCMQSPFEPGNVSRGADFVVVNDFFSDELIGGAELTTDAIVAELRGTGASVSCVRSRDLTPTLISEHRDPLWIICNFAQADVRALTTLIKVARFVIVEYDFKFCSARSPEKHAAESGKRCNCGASDHGKFISEMFSAAQLVVWMSDKQRDIVRDACPTLRPRKQLTASSVFDDTTLQKLLWLEDRRSAGAYTLSKWLVLNSDSWIKGTKQSLTAVVASKREFELCGSLPYDEMLLKLASSAGVVYHPPGGDTCPRFIIEAAVMGVPVDCNENVLHLSEDWASLRGVKLIEALKEKRRNLISAIAAERRPKISGYVTTLDAVERGYPIEQCVTSMFAFCSEVIVCDGGSKDETISCVTSAAARAGFKSLRVIENVISTEAPDFALQDGKQKARARAACSGEYCWQQDADEIVDERDAHDILFMAARMPNDVDVVCLPVIEFWGSLKRIRLDVTPWKWRLSRNLPELTHGVPKSLRVVDKAGVERAMHGTDGCDMISSITGEPAMCASFMTHEAEQLRMKALSGDQNALLSYDSWFSSVTFSLPSVFHLSWLDIARKLRLYRDYWTAHWASLYGEKPKNVFFEKEWCDVSEDEIDELSLKLSNIGGWVWHRPWDGTNTPSLTLRRVIPKLVTEATR